MWSGHQRELGNLAHTALFYVVSDCMSYGTKYNQHAWHDSGKPNQENFEKSMSFSITAWLSAYMSVHLILGYVVCRFVMMIVIRKWYVSNALKLNQNSNFLFTKTLQ